MVHKSKALSIHLSVRPLIYLLIYPLIMYLSIFHLCNNYFLIFIIIVPISVKLTNCSIEMSDSNFKADQNINSLQITFKVCRQDYCELIMNTIHPIYTLMFLCKLACFICLLSTSVDKLTSIN